jgi:hypothetical protein
MGLLYTKFYLDFEEEEWNQISNNPAIFQTIKDGISLDIEDVSHKAYKLKFKKGGKIEMLWVVGRRYRFVWNNDDLLNSIN